MDTKEQSINVPGLILSHQYWASEAALVALRRNKEHRFHKLSAYTRYMQIIVFELGHEFGHGVEKARAKSCLASKIHFKNVSLHCKSLVTWLLS